MAKVKCRYCHKDIDKSQAYNPSPRLYYCNNECYQKHQKKKANYENYMQKRYNQILVMDSTEMTDTIKYIKPYLGDINEAMVKRQITKLIESHHTYKGIELTIDYAINILSLKLDPKYGVSYIIEKYYNDAKKYWIKKQRIKKKINEFDFDSKVNVVEVRDRNNGLKDRLKTEEF